MTKAPPESRWARPGMPSLDEFFAAQRLRVQRMAKRRPRWVEYAKTEAQDAMLTTPASSLDLTYKK